MCSQEQLAVTDAAPCKPRHLRGVNQGRSGQLEGRAQQLVSELVALWRASAARMAAAFSAVLVLAVQTDVIGVPWIAFSIWGLAGLVLSNRCFEVGTVRSDRCLA